jgi:hypothetical protein
MIKVNKTQPAPLSLANSHDKMTKAVNDVVSKGGTVFLATKGSKTAKNSAPPGATKIEIDDDKYKPEDAKAILKLDHFGKCAFCEARFMDTAGGDVEHFRPKKRYDEDLPFTVVNKPQNNLGYFHFVYDWNNHLWSCKECNETYKKNYFGLMPDMSTPPPDYPDEETISKQDFELALNQFNKDMDRWGKYQGSVHSNWNAGNVPESAILIDPSTENPRPHINFESSTGLAVGAQLDDEDNVITASARGGKNILVLGLNRRELVFARSRHLTLLRGVFLEMLRSHEQAIQFLQWQRGDQWFNTASERTRRDRVIYPKQISVSDPNKSCLEFLLYSTTPEAPFSALAMDALAVWSRELMLHLLKLRPHVTQLQSPQATTTFETRSVNDLLPLSIHKTIVNQYKKDQDAIAELRVQVNTLGPIWQIDPNPSTVCFICRVQLHGVIAAQQTLTRHVALRHTAQFEKEYDEVYRRIGHVEEALLRFGCTAKDWEKAVKNLEENMEQMAPDLVHDLIVPATNIFSECRRLDGVLGNPPPPDQWTQTQFQQWQLSTQQLSDSLAQLKKEVEARVQAALSDVTKGTAQQMLERIKEAEDALGKLSSGQRSDLNPADLEIESAPEFVTVTATKVMKPPAHSDAIWDSVILPALSK